MKKKEKIVAKFWLGGTSSPLWSFANIKWVVANITHGAAEILHGAAIIFCGMASILSDVPAILHVQHQFFEIFEVFWDFQREKYTFFQKCSKNGLVAKKMVITF